MAPTPVPRFEFGRNWIGFLKEVDEDRTLSAIRSLQELLGVESLNGKRFLDAGSGSGLFSLAASRLGAQVHSFDEDPSAVVCADELKRRFGAAENSWVISQGSVLDSKYLLSLGSFDVVYCWGVLHHTGRMWEGLECIGLPVRPGGLLCVAIYNDQGSVSGRWAALKKLYNRSGRTLRAMLILGVGAYFKTRSILNRCIQLQNPLTFKDWTRKSRGMSGWHDLIDWVGGYPFETAKPEAIFDFYRSKGYELVRLKTCGGGHGCNEFLFRKRG